MIEFLITIISVLIGYALGKNSITKDTFQEIKKSVEHKVYPQFKQPSGTIQRPSAERLNVLNNPKVEEEEEEMTKMMEKGIQPLTP